MNHDVFMNCWTMHQGWKDNKPLSVEELLRRILRLLLALRGRFLCPDGRALLYGILGMVGDPELPIHQRYLYFDYEKIPAIVFRDLAMFFIESGSLGYHGGRPCEL